MVDSSVATSPAEPEGDLKRSITGRLLFFYVLGNVLGSGTYVLVTVAAFTGLAYAELATKYPRAAGASLYVNQAFGSKGLTFMTTVLYLSATFVAAGSLAAGFAQYFGQVWELPPALLVMIVFVLLVGVIYIGRGKADFSTLTEFSSSDNVVFAIIAGVALSFFAMTGFENAADVAEETIDPSRNFPRALIGGMAAAGVIYVLVAMSAALVVPVDTLAGSDAALLEVIRAGVLPVSVSVMVLVVAVIAMVAITNTTLVQVVTQRGSCTA